MENPTININIKDFAEQVAKNLELTNCSTEKIENNIQDVLLRVLSQAKSIDDLSGGRVIQATISYDGKETTSYSISIDGKPKYEYKHRKVHTVKHQAGRVFNAPSLLQITELFQELENINDRFFSEDENPPLKIY